MRKSHRHAAVILAAAAIGVILLGRCTHATGGTAPNRDPQRAASSDVKAANAGDVESMLETGMKYWHGDGVEVDRARAYMWIALASRHAASTRADPQLTARIEAQLAALSKQVTTSERHDGKALRDAWDAAHGYTWKVSGGYEVARRKLQP